MLPYRRRPIAQAAEYVRDLVELKSQDIEDAVIEAARVYNVSLTLLIARVQRMGV